SAPPCSLPCRLRRPSCMFRRSSASPFSTLMISRPSRRPKALLLPMASSCTLTLLPQLFGVGEQRRHGGIGRRRLFLRGMALAARLAAAVVAAPGLPAPLSIDLLAGGVGQAHG